MSNPIEVEALLDLVRFAGPGAASRLAEGRSIFTPEDQVDLVVGRALVEALGSYVSDEIDHPFGPESPTSFPQPEGIHNHSRSEEPPADLGVARQLLAKCTSIGVLIPRLQLAIREAQTMDEKAGIVAVLDRALEAHRELSDWCSRAGAYNTDRTASVVGEFDELVREIKGKASGPWATVDSPMHAAVELGEAKAGPEGGWPIVGRPWTSKPLGKTGVKTQKRIGEADVEEARESGKRKKPSWKKMAQNHAEYPRHLCPQCGTNRQADGECPHGCDVDAAGPASLGLKEGRCEYCGSAMRGDECGVGGCDGERCKQCGDFRGDHANGTGANMVGQDCESFDGLKPKRQRKMKRIGEAVGAFHGGPPRVFTDDEVGERPCSCGAATVGAWSGQGVHHGAHKCARVVDTSRATGPARNPHSITNRDRDEQ